MKFRFACLRKAYISKPIHRNAEVIPSKDHFSQFSVTHLAQACVYLQNKIADRQSSLYDARKNYTLAAVIAEGAENRMSRTTLEHLKKTYHSLDEDDQRLLQILSIIYHPVGQTQFQNVVQRLNWTDQRGQGLENVIGKPWRERLLKTQLITYKNLLQCNEVIAEYLSQLAADSGNYRNIAMAAEAELPQLPNNHRLSIQYSRCNLRYLRDALYLKECDGVFKLLGIEQPFTSLEYARSEPLINLCAKLDEAQFLQLPAAIRYQVAAPVVAHDYQRFKGEQHWVDLLFASYAAGELAAEPSALAFVAEQKFLGGDVNTALTLVEGNTSVDGMALHASIRFLQTDYAQAHDLFETALANKRKSTRKRAVILSGLLNIFYLLTLIKTDPRANLKKIHQYVRAAMQPPIDYQLAHQLFLLEKFANVLSGSLKVEESDIVETFIADSDPPYSNLLRMLVLYWLRQEPQESGLTALKKSSRQAHQAGYQWFAVEGARLLQCFAAGYAATPCFEDANH